jgi:hypothetical protein
MLLVSAIAIAILGAAGEVIGIDLHDRSSWSAEKTDGSHSGGKDASSPLR